ncbi:MAG: acyl carrier protein [Thermomicrobiales bacterium]
MAATGTSNGRPAGLATTQIRELVLAELAVVQALDPAELDREMDAAGGEVEIDSPQAEAILARLEGHFGCKLPGVSDLEPEQFNSISALVDLIGRRLSVAAPSIVPSAGDWIGTDIRVA